MRRPLLTAVLVPFVLLTAAPAVAAPPEVRITIQGHRFVPAEVKVPAGVKIKLLIRNEDATPEEFESHELNREKIVPGKGTAVVFVGPLKPGRYPFFGEFNVTTARGTLVAE
jgi:Cupredoxin-like domain